MNYIEIGNISVQIVRKDIKNMHLSVYPPHGRVRLAVPANVSDETLRLFAISKLPWIRRNQKKFENQDRQTERKYLPRESHYFLGKRYLLKIVEENKPPKVAIRKPSHIELHVRSGSTPKQCEKVLHEWYRAELKKLTAGLIEKWEREIGVSVDNWGIKLMKTKWGTCNIEKRRIWLNLELAKKPVRCIEYIIVHEMVHLLERHHNDVFLAYMNHFLPNWKSLKDELNNLPVSHVDWDY